MSEVGSRTSEVGGRMSEVGGPAATTRVENDLRITLLGTGTSTGVPVPTCTCEVCTSNDPRDKRLRCSCLVEVNGLTILIDVGPDFRAQCLAADISRIDAVLLTHEHFDHIAGLDDLRPFILWHREPIPVFASPRTASFLRRRMDYIFMDGSYPGVPKLDLVEIGSRFYVESRYDDRPPVPVTQLDVFHGDLPISGFRIADFGYVTDASRLPEETIEALVGVDTLVLSALRFQPHRSHFTLDEAVGVAQRIGARKTYFIHMTHNVLHARDNAALPDGIELGYDGLTVEVGVRR